MAVTVNVLEPLPIGVPDRLPFVLSVSPPGNAPAVTLQAKGADPPLAVKVKPAYGSNCAPAGGWPGPITICESLMSSGTDAVATWWGLEESVTVSVKAKVPAIWGVPDSCPEPLSIKPGGREPDSFQVKGGDPPEAENV